MIEADQLEIQTQTEFFDDLVGSIATSSTEAGLMFMQYEEGELTGAITDELQEAHARGVDARIDLSEHAWGFTRLDNREIPNKR